MKPRIITKTKDLIFSDKTMFQVQLVSQVKVMIKRQCFRYN